jgi:hypothetical protein
VFVPEEVEDRHHRLASGTPFLASVGDDLQRAIEGFLMVPA